MSARYLESFNGIELIGLTGRGAMQTRKVDQSRVDKPVD
jgi:hypothetical protein